MEPGEIAILARTRQALLERARPALEKAGLRGAALSPDQDVDSTSVSLGTLHSAKGLEFRAVAVVEAVLDRCAREADHEVSIEGLRPSLRPSARRQDA